MFRHIKVALNKLFNLDRDAAALKFHPPIGVAPLEPRVHNIDLSELFARPPEAPNYDISAARRAAADAVGKPFPTPWIKPLPKRFFWKQDAGALDGIGRRAWRIYRSLD